ncbi:hypothetical protein [Hyphomicrobium sp. CS1GBMeth3]|uniref:hypothetical protein n=1 Tax=Hyphomicrobium sp. CS1GBMeth3 TaxID=1892845 RepID=UPI000931E92E|nr:hypothetical protein [Hyphomicrobium sp. CS1GBMeth3]
MDTTTLALASIDIGKDVFRLVGFDTAGKNAPSTQGRAVGTSGYLQRAAAEPSGPTWKALILAGAFHRSCAENSSPELRWKSSRAISPSIKNRIVTGRPSLKGNVIEVDLVRP